MIQDIWKEIALRCDILTLQNLICVNQSFYTLYDHLYSQLYFWNEKLIYENSVPILFDDDEQRNPEYLVDYIKTCDAFTDYKYYNMIMYVYMKYAERQAKIHLLADKIANHGMIHVEIYALNNILYYYTLDPILTNFNFDVYITNIKIKSIHDGYDFYLTCTDGKHLTKN